MAEKPSVSRVYLRVYLYVFLKIVILINNLVKLFGSPRDAIIFKDIARFINGLFLLVPTGWM